MNSVLFSVFWLFSVTIAFKAGHSVRQVANKIKKIEQEVKQKIDKPKEVEETPSELIDLQDPIKEAMYEHEKLMKRLNSDQDS